jgi:restriction system protein
MSSPFHFPPEVMQLLVSVIPLLNRSKPDVFLFFKGAGVADSHMDSLFASYRQDRNSVNKYQIARTVLERLNEAGDKTLTARREVIKRIVEWEDFSMCWPDDQLKAKGLVAELRQIVNVKDSFTRMRDERDKEAEQIRRQNERRHAEEKRKLAEIDSVKSALFALFSESDPHKRGKALEPVLNRLFAVYDVLIRENFKMKIEGVAGVVEQIDGVIELDGNVYLVEMKWEKEPLGKDKVSSHLVGVFNRGHSRGILISASGYTQAALQTCRESLHHAPFCLCLLEEIVFMLENKLNLKDMLRSKIQAALIDKEPLYRVLPGR